MEVSPSSRKFARPVGFFERTAKPPAVPSHILQQLLPAVTHRRGIGRTTKWGQPSGEEPPIERSRRLHASPNLVIEGGHGMGRDLTELPALLLEWTPPWVRLRREDAVHQADYGELCQSAHWGLVVGNGAVDWEADDNAGKVLPHRLFGMIGRHLGAGVACTIAVYGVLVQFRDLAGMPRVYLDPWWWGCAALGSGTLFFMNSVFARLREQFHAVFPNEAQRRKVLRRTALRRSVRTKLFGWAFAAASLVLWSAAVAGYLWYCVRDPISFQATADAKSLGELESDGFIQVGLSPDAEPPPGRRDLVITFTRNLLAPAPTWSCQELGNREHNPSMARWMVQFLDRPNLFQAMPGEWLADEKSATTQDSFLGSEVFYAAFRMTADIPWSHAPPRLHLKVANMDRLEEYVAKSTVRLGIMVGTRCPPPKSGVTALNLIGTSTVLDARSTE